VQAYGHLPHVIPREDHATPDWALYLDQEWKDRERTWAARFVDWTDYSLPVDESDAFDAFIEAHQRASSGELVEVACAGGTGRTGTALACVAVLDGMPPDEAIKWVRKHYHRLAIETLEQERLIARFAARLGSDDSA
jgi:protein-tyrosine phosphatase